jgi:hypothetical protein
MPETRGPIARFLSDDHRRLAELLRTACESETTVDLAAYEEFRAGILRHIGMEERVLLPAARRRRDGSALPIARLLRLDHGAIATLLVPSPTPSLLRQLADVLEPHNEIEERPGGLYAVCDELLADEAPGVIEALRAFPRIPLAPHQDGPNVHRHIEETLTLARRAWAGETGSQQD